ncbi:hypothetical protein NQ314_018152 [Rhamnusium bicolor]|uniref:Uncharacterized protein n=1 Tax=Rhamnusium bicolor TaxID=1586634 RepID=A0AAV8WSP2_9CUCU|nr:hypothetical protein NQ314_018152 [Rhamnusium bicolor]
MSCGDTHLAINTDDVEVCDGTEINSQIRSNNHSNTNGSIITMTLKNNHLIVETEERNDIEEDSRETTMKYCPGARDGVFVVEVQQGVRRSPGSGGPTSCAEPEISISVSDQCALVHNPPDSEYYIETASPNTDTPDSLAVQIKTGLAQSDTSLTHPSYCYTNQQCYDNGSYGYNVYSGYVNDEPLRRLPDDTRPKIMSAVYKTKANSDSLDIPLAALNGLKDAINDIEKSSDDEVQEEQNRLGNLKKNMLDSSQKFDKITNNISPANEKEAEMGSVDYENKGVRLQ